MTVSTTTRKADFILDQVENEFNFTFRALTTAPADIKCIVTTNGVDKLLTYTTDYTVAVAWDGVGGVVTLVSPATLSKGTLTVYRDTTNIQGSDYDDYNQFPADTLETDLDRRTMVSQEDEEDIARTIKLAITSSLSDIELPTPEANKVIGWNATADGLENKETDLTATLPLLITSNTISLPVNASVTLGTLVVDTERVNTQFITKDPYIDVRAYASINAAVTAIGSTQTTLLIPTAQTLTASLTIPSTCTLKILQGGSIVKASNYTLTINGSFEVGLYQVFSGFSSGNVTFGTGAIGEACPEWFGLSTSGSATVNALAINSALSSTKNVRLSTGNWNINELVLNIGNHLIGSGRLNSVLTYTGSGVAITADGAPGGATWRAKLEGFDLFSSTGTIGVKIKDLVDFEINNVTVSGFSTCGVNLNASTLYVISVAILNSSIEANGGDGVLFNGSHVISHTEIRNCRIRDNTAKNIDVAAGPSIILLNIDGNDLEASAIPVYIDHGFNININGNYFEGGNPNVYLGVTGIVYGTEINGNQFNSTTGGGIQLGTGTGGSTQVRTASIRDNYFYNLGAAIDPVNVVLLDIGPNSNGLGTYIATPGAGSSKIKIFDASGHVGIGTITAPARLTLAAGATDEAPLQLTAGTNLTTAISGSMEYNGTNLFFTDSTPTRKTIAYTDSNITGTAANLSGTPTLPSGTTLVAPVLGTPASGDLANCTFPTFNQSTTGTAKNLTTGQHLKATIIDPNSVYGKSATICLIPSTDAAITITSIVVTTSSASYEAAGDLKYADTFIALANPVVINDFDTTSGVRVDTSITSASVASGKCVYLSFDSAPSASMTQVSFDITYNY